MEFSFLHSLLTFLDFSLWENFKNIIDPEYLIKTGGLLILIFIVFAETGLFFGFFFPGDSLLFTAGLLCGIGILETNVFILLLSLNIAAIAGNFVGYGFGKFMGKRLFHKEDTWIFKKKYLHMTDAFFLKHGSLALILGRFLPIVRTFAPIIAGVVNMNFKKFTFYNITGSVLWIFSFILAGYFLGKNFPGIKEYLHYIIIGIVVVTIIPVIRTYFKQRSLHAKQKQVVEESKNTTP